MLSSGTAGSEILRVAISWAHWQESREQAGCPGLDEHMHGVCDRRGGAYMGPAGTSLASQRKNYGLLKYAEPLSLSIWSAKALSILPFCLQRE